VHGVKFVEQTEMNTAEPLSPVPSFSESEVAIENLKRYKSPGIINNLAKSIQAGCNMF
jgi:hypothetical protein